MKEYQVTIEETLSRMVTVNAENEEEAEKIVKEKYLNQEIVLNADDISSRMMEVDAADGSYSGDWMKI